MNKRFFRITFTHIDEVSMDLFHIMKTSNVPLVMFDGIRRWLKRHEGNIVSHGTSRFLTRNNFIESMNKKLYTNSVSIMKPKLLQILLSSGRTSNVVIFQWKKWYSRYQGDWLLPDMFPFRNGLNSIDRLKAKGRFTRIFILFPVVSNSYLIKNLCTRKMVKLHDNYNTPMITRIFLMKLFQY